MPIIFKAGDLFQQDVDAIVNTVNCVGVMGKGVALEFKRRWPKNYTAYRKLCKDKELRPGSLFIYEQGDLLDNVGPRYLVNFPTKDHWRSKSRIEYVREGLSALRAELEKGEIKSIAMPPLGCGNGGLDWFVVKDLIKDLLSDVDANVIVLEPFAERDQPEHLNTYPVELTFRRAALLKTLGDLEPIFGGGYDRLSLQKIAYFLQELGLEFGLKFERNHFGPYSESLKKAFASLERQGAMAGFSEDDQISHVTQSGYAAADEYLITEPTEIDVSELVDKLSKLIEGFESPYGLELLATVHHLANYEGCADTESLAASFHDWNERKREKFSRLAIENAFNRLREDGLID